MNNLLIGVLKAIALHGPVAWAAAWHRRVMLAQMHEWFEIGPVKLGDVTPWGFMRPVSAAVDEHSATPQS